MANQVTIFSNGMADYRRQFELQGGKSREVTLHVRKEHLADVLASLSVFGNVSVSDPPTYSPDSFQEGNLTLDAARVLEDLALKLAGAQVTVQRGADALQGILMGLHGEPEATGGDRVRPKSVVVSTDSGIARVPLREIKRLEFQDETIRAEIDKALQRNVQTIKPDSTEVRFTLETEDEQAEAVVQYTVPAAAWKITYRLRESGDGKLALQGLAVVDNNTEEDWKDVIVTVVTGEPITFSTDLAEAKTPGRKRVNVVQEQALGAVEVERSMAKRGYVGGDESNLVAHSMLPPAAARGGAFAEAAPSLQADTEIREVGDYSVFESRQPISIGAHRSVIFPVFETDLEDGKIVLYFKQSDHDTRPFRAFQFRNRSGHSLGRGVCTVFQEGMYAGNCIMPPTKEEDERLLPYSLETGVLVDAVREPPDEAVVQVVLSEGICQSGTRVRRVTRYFVENGRDAAFDFVLDHLVAMDSTAKSKVRLRREKQWDVLPDDQISQITQGLRLQFALAAREAIEIEVVSSQIAESRFQLLSDDRLQWLQSNLVARNGPLAQDPAIRKCLAKQRELDEQGRTIRALSKQVETLEQRQERLRKNLQVAGQDEQSSRWRSELGAAEDEINRIQQEEAPQQEARRRELQLELQRLLAELAIEWHA